MFQVCDRGWAGYLCLLRRLVTKGVPFTASFGPRRSTRPPATRGRVQLVSCTRTFTAFSREPAGRPASIVRTLRSIVR